MLISTLVLQDSTEKYIPSFFYKLLWDLSLSPKCLSSFLSKFSKKNFHNIFQKNFQIYGGHIPRKSIESRHFYLCFLYSYSKLSPKFLSSQKQTKILYFQIAIFRKSVSPQQQKGVKKTMICFI